MSDRLGRVFSPGVIGTLTLPHRIIMGAMHLGLETRDDDGAALATFYAERARGSRGLMVTGGAAVSPAGAGGPRYGVLTDQAFTARLSRVVTEVHDAGGLIALQLFHAGRYAPAGKHGPVAPSPVFSRLSGCEPRELTGAEVLRTLDDFARGGALARSLGFDAVEIMGSEGYLIDQFLSPLTNRREDEWGGDAERRMRFGLEAMRHVRAAAGDEFPVIVRMSGTDLMDGGVPRGEVLGFARALARAGADALNIGIGWHESPVPTVQAIVPPGTWAPVAAAVKEAVGALPVISSNRVNRVQIAEDILAAGQADFVSMARPFLADPRLVGSARRGRPVNICVGCNQACIDRSLTDTGDTVSCMVNPRAGRETDLPAPAQGARPTRVAVVGGGPAGLIAARDLAAAGHRVTLFESAGALGGQFRLAAAVPGKDDYAAAVRYLTAELTELGGEIALGRPVGGGDASLLRSFSGVIVATGVQPRRLGIPGTDLPHVLYYPGAFAPVLGKRVVIIGGGGIAVDVAHYASHHGHQVTVLHRGARVGARLGKSSRWAVIGALREQGVELRAGMRCERITPDGVEVLGGDGSPELIGADTVVIAIGQVAEETAAATAATAREAGVWHRVIGGAGDPAGLDAVRAMAEGVRAASEFITGQLLLPRPARHPPVAGCRLPVAHTIRRLPEMRRIFRYSARFSGKFFLSWRFCVPIR
jgi:2,4-dienoyl-CoA reductase (NADPH2)